MPAFDVGRYVMTVLLIGVVAGGMMWAYDQFAGALNSLIAAGQISHVGVQTATVIYYAIVAFAPVNLLFATVNALLVANARSEMASPLVQTNPGAHLVLAAVILCCFGFNLFASAFLDPFMVGMSGLDIDFAGTTNIMAMMFNAAHVLSAIACGIGYLYMIFNCLKVESIQWSM